MTTATTSPPLGAAGWDGVPRPGDRHLLSASSVSGALAAPGLERWKRKRVAAWAVDNVATLAQLVATLGREQAIDTVAGAVWAKDEGQTLSAADRGTLTHIRLEAHLGVGTYVEPPAEHAPQLAPYFAQLDDAVAKLLPQAVDVESVVYVPELGLAGRFDSKVRFAALPQLGTVLLDCKTADAPKRIYGDSFGLQLCTYGCATHQAHGFEPRVGKGPGGARIYYVDDAELEACVAPAPVDSYAVLQVTPTNWRLVPLQITDTTRDYLRSVVNAWRWLHLASSQVVGAELAAGAA